MSVDVCESGWSGWDGDGWLFCLLIGNSISVVSSCGVISLMCVSVAGLIVSLFWFDFFFGFFVFLSVEGWIVILLLLVYIICVRAEKSCLIPSASMIVRVVRV